MVFQLPYVAFPESPPAHKMRDYDHLWGYFHSDRLKWSYGAIKGREGDLWQRRAASEPAAEMVETLRGAGFGGVMLFTLPFALVAGSFLALSLFAARRRLARD